MGSLLEQPKNYLTFGSALLVSAMWKFILYILLTFCTFNLGVLYSLAQYCLNPNSPVQDTLDAKGYYPLEIGNRWEYVSDLNFALSFASRVEVVKDTLISDTLFYKLEARAYGFENDLGNFGDQLIEGTKSYRYESVVDGKLFSFFRDEITPQGVEFNRPFCSEYAFNGFTNFSIDGGYQGEYSIFIGAETLTASFAAIKSYGCCFGITTYGHGLGKIETIGDPSLKTGLVYAKVGALDFGLPLDSLFSVSSVNTEEAPQFSQANTLTISPNPLRNQGILHIKMHSRGVVTVIITDILGKERSRPIEAESLQPGDHEIHWLVDGYESGVYFLQLYINGLIEKSKKAIVVN